MSVTPEPRPTHTCPMAYGRLDRAQNTAWMTAEARKKNLQSRSM